jgi:hypothetical protein
MNNVSTNNSEAAYNTYPKTSRLSFTLAWLREVLIIVVGPGSTDIRVWIFGPMGAML